VTTVPIKRALALLCTPLLALGVVGCASTASSSSFQGEHKTAAQAVTNLQSEATAGEAKKICATLLSSAVTARLNTAPGGCTQALKNQLTQVDTPELTIGSVQLLDATSAKVQVKSVYSGKSQISTLSLVKEGGKWKVSKLS